MKLNLPKEYLSYSQCRLWLDNKNQYRERYFEMKEQRASKYMIFGSEIAKGLEDKSINIPLLPVYPVSEYQIKLEVEGVPFYAYIDSYWPEKFKFREYKTGTWKQNGIPRWTQREVDNHMQLDVYSLLIKEKNGEVDDECHLDWIHTQPKIKK